MWKTILAFTVRAGSREGAGWKEDTQIDMQTDTHADTQTAFSFLLDAGEDVDDLEEFDQTTLESDTTGEAEKRKQGNEALLPRLHDDLFTHPHTHTHTHTYRQTHTHTLWLCFLGFPPNPALLSAEEGHANDQEDTQAREARPATTTTTTAPASSSSSVWTFAYYQSFFDVDTMEVTKRMKLSALPTPKFLAHAQGKSDLYGPFWISTTLIFALALMGNLAHYTATPEDKRIGWQYDFSKVTLAATAIYGYITIVRCAIALLCVVLVLCFVLCVLCLLGCFFAGPIANATLACTQSPSAFLSAAFFLSAPSRPSLLARADSPCSLARNEVVQDVWFGDFVKALRMR